MTKITFSLTSYKIPFLDKRLRFGALLNVTDDYGFSSWGEISPLPKWSLETLQESLTQLENKKEEILKTSWNKESCFKKLRQLNLFPSVSFALESALLPLLDPLPPFTSKKSALFMGSFQEILKQAKKKEEEGYTSAKLKVSTLSLKEAEDLIHLLKDRFFLRIDVNRAWDTKDSLSFFSKFKKDTFDYIEEPFKNPKDLHLFTHPLAVDESFPSLLSLKELKNLPTLKALIYKPTMQGGMAYASPLLESGLNLILSSSFETSIGLHAIAQMAQRMGLSSPIGTGTSHFLPCPFQDKIVNFTPSPGVLIL